MLYNSFGQALDSVYHSPTLSCQIFGARLGKINRREIRSTSNPGVCKHCQFVFASSVLSVMSVSGFPLIIMSAHAQCSMCTCSVEGIPSLVCLHMLSVGASLISMQCKHCSMWQTHGELCGEDEGFLVKMKKKLKILHLHQKSVVFATKSVVLTELT